MKKILKIVRLAMLLPVLYCRYFFVYVLLVSMALPGYDATALAAKIILSFAATCGYCFIMRNCEVSKPLTRLIARTLKITYRRQHMGYMAYVSHMHRKKVKLFVYKKGMMIAEAFFTYAVSGEVLHASEAIERRKAIRLFLNKI
jgi:hypothetical protein